jgi:hypothetical protein
LASPFNFPAQEFCPIFAQYLPNIGRKIFGKYWAKLFCEKIKGRSQKVVLGRAYDFKLGCFAVIQTFANTIN